MPPLPRPVREVWFLSLVAVMAALVGGIGCNAAPEPVQLLRDAVVSVEDVPSVSVDFGVSVNIVMGEEKSDQQVAFRYRATSGRRFLFTPLTEAGAPDEGLTVKSNGAVTLTQLISRRKHTLDDNVDGFAAFVRSPLSAGLGNGLGGLALSFLSGQAMEEMIRDVTASEYLGVEEVDGAECYHTRYTVEDSLTWDAWITTDASPVIRKIVPDLTQMKEDSPASKQFDNFDYAIEFSFDNWDRDAGLKKNDFRVVEPEGSFYVDSFTARAPRAPHPMLGQPAPSFELNDMNGNPVNLADHLGKDVVLLDFWATWCPPCVAALPAVTEVVPV